jgi:hypothetical protein
MSSTSMYDQYTSSDLTSYFSSSIMVEVFCIFIIMSLGSLFDYSLWNRHLDQWWAQDLKHGYSKLLTIKNLVCIIPYSALQFDTNNTTTYYIFIYQQFYNIRIKTISDEHKIDKNWNYFLY